MIENIIFEFLSQLIATASIAFGVLLVGLALLVAIATRDGAR